MPANTQHVAMYRCLYLAVTQLLVVEWNGGRNQWNGMVKSGQMKSVVEWNQ